MVKLDRILRKIAPSTALLSRSGLFAPILAGSDFLGRGLLRAFTDQKTPPLKYIVRTGAANTILLPHLYYLGASYSLWMYFFSRGLASLESDVVDIGSGVGKSAVALRDIAYHGIRFEGTYHGFDVDPEMVRWCVDNFPRDRFRFTCLDMRSSVYNPEGSADSRPPLDRVDASADLVFSQSLFSHLLEEDIRHYLRESYRVLRTGGTMSMTFFCVDDLQSLGLLGGRWTFKHRLGAARVENRKYPESAVAYPKEWMTDAARDAGFGSVSVILPGYQSTLECIK